MEGMLVCPGNYAPLTPISFLEQAAIVHGDKTSIIYGATRFSWRQTYDRCLKLASALVNLKISPGDIVAALAPNIPALYELHFGVPMAGAVLSALNVRLDAAMLASKLQELEAKIIFADHLFVELAQRALDTLSYKNLNLPLLVLIPECPSLDELHKPNDGTLEYDGVLEMGRVDDFEIVRPGNECDPVSVNFTSGSTGVPKGVIYSHRAAYLNSLAQISRFDMGESPVFLWAVDMFRCNGWCFPWTMAALGGTNICLNNVSGKSIFNALAIHRVTHICGAPSILIKIADFAQEVSHPSRPLPWKVHVIVAGALPTTQVLMKVEKMGFYLSHGYGMTEALGPVIVRPLKTSSQHEKIRPQDPINNHLLVDVKDPETTKSVPQDGKTIGEVMFKGNLLMSGYFKNPKATHEAFRGGWYHTGDLAVRQPNGHIQMKDRAKDMINFGGEPISTLEIEAVLNMNPKVLESAVVGKRLENDHLKETPCAFVQLKEGFNASAEEIVEFCRDHLPNFMVPYTVIFGELPVNSTGKVQKFVLKKAANVIHSC
ncbi:acyl-activating enzyme 1 peroxisomal [Tripterygium wilfordii]|uniref:Acyl-activating enzyme 1 peroxisomal n=1 Tax=Tripterygium wilfordii TaxID=458696 RepID=A0A7J7CVR3_TRIWF|nr:probable acyl-activating enzyme 1, peroxisomal [Tripterygium wilfordii]KAF5738098.1 acyl-activating enzyme 1 peroxisomal [Tripterygium wilfordii]